MHAPGVVRVVSLLKPNHTDSFILLFFFANTKIPYYILSIQHL